MALRIQNKQRHRSLFLDQIKAIMIALVIASHTALLASLSSDGVGQLIKGAPLFEGMNLWFVWVCNTFFMNILFLISGYLLPQSIQKQGLKQFIKNRLIRLGIPLILSIILINNILPIGGLIVPDSPAFGESIINLPLNRIGPQWFLVVLILFNALYCIWVGLRKTKFSVHQTTPVPGWRSWLISAVILGLAEMEMSHFSNVWINLKETNLDGLGYQGMHLFTYGFLFAVGCKAASHRWIERINQRLAYSWFQASMLISLTLLAIMVATILVGNNSQFLQQAWPILSALIPFVGWGYIAMFLTWTQQHEHIGGAWLAKAGRDSFGAYLIHMPILYGCFMPLYLSGVTNIWVLSLSATISAIVLSFWGSHQLRNIPSIRRII